jgi:hypothetical protein
MTMSMRMTWAWNTKGQKRTERDNVFSFFLPLQWRDGLKGPAAVWEFEKEGWEMNDDVAFENFTQKANELRKIKVNQG